MKKESVARVIAKLPGFRKRGPFFVGTCNDNVIAGYSIDAPPSHTYVWRFVLPSYDRNEFLHMALGKRVVALPRVDDQNGPDAASLSAILVEDWAHLKDVREAGDLLSYIEKEDLEGEYVGWTKYLTYIKQGRFEEAETLGEGLRSDPSFPRVALVANNLKSLSESMSKAGWDGAQHLLAEWGRETTATFC